jgi:hypothetical protein
VIADSKGDIQRSLEVIEFACGIPAHTSGANIPTEAGIIIHSSPTAERSAPASPNSTSSHGNPVMDVRHLDRRGQHLHPQTVRRTQPTGAAGRKAGPASRGAPMWCTATRWRSTPS